MTTPLPQGPPPRVPKPVALRRRNAQRVRALDEELDAAAGAGGELFPDAEVTALCNPHPRAQSGDESNEDDGDGRRMQQKFKNQRKRTVSFSEEVEVVKFDKDEAAPRVLRVRLHSPEPMVKEVRPLPGSSTLCGGTAESGDQVTALCSRDRGEYSADDETSGDSSEGEDDLTNPDASVTPPPGPSESEEGSPM